MAERFRVEIVPTQSVTAMEYLPAASNRAGVVLILGHGAGAGQTSSFMVEFATALAARGIGIVTFNFPYSEQGRRVPDPNVRLEACFRAIIEHVRRRNAATLAIGGKSMGARIASQVAADSAGELAGLVFLGYPLHAPGRPHQLRATHLRNVRKPMLFVQGSRDAFGSPGELRPIIERLEPQSDLYVVEGGDHSFKVLRSAGVGQQEVHRAVQDRIETWLRGLTA